VPAVRRRVFPLFFVFLFAAACGGPCYFDLQTDVPEKQGGLMLDKVLLVEDAEISETYRDFRIVCRESPFQVRYHNSASWSRSPDELIEEAVVHFWKKRAVFKKVNTVGSEDDPDWVMRMRVNVIEKSLIQKKWQARLAMDVEIVDPESEKTILAHSFDRKLALGKNKIRLLPDKASMILHEELLKIEAKLFGNERN
jgi:ABC-type uncharacterized transport system auxiliary subunit